MKKPQQSAFLGAKFPTYGQSWCGLQEWNGQSLLDLLGELISNQQVYKGE